MKKKLLFTILAGTSFSTFGQMIYDSVEMGPGYANESYYSFENQEQANVDNTNWDLAFDLSGFGASVRTNEHTGTEVYVYPNGTDWTSVDTTGMTFESMHNSDKTWGVGSLDQSFNPSNSFDLGWGVYNQVTHQILGDSIHILKLADGSFKKLMIEGLIGGVFSFKHADLDGTNEVASTVTKSNFTDKRFAYYSIVNDQVIDREPTTDSWDIVFTKYVTEYLPGVSYGVTGVLSNNGTYVREASGVDPNTAALNDYSVDSVINVIGFDWKTFNMGTYTYDIEPDLSYFVQDLSGNIWHLVFTKFEGSSTGKIVFGKEQVATASIEEFNDISAFAIYPNPASQNVNLVFHSNVAQSTLTVTNMSGKTMISKELTSTGLTTEKLNVSEFPKGFYFVRLATENGVITQKLIVQ